jgi:hypothetical protein
MEGIPKEKFAQLIKKAINIDESITQTIADEFKVSKATLERWSNGDSIPPADVRLNILQRTSGIMLGTLGTIVKYLGESDEKAGKRDEGSDN